MSDTDYNKFYRGIYEDQESFLWPSEPKLTGHQPRQISFDDQKV